MNARLAAISDERMHLVLTMVLTFATGIVDAVGYVGLERVFTGNMTGNVMILGMAVVGAENLPILGPFQALVAFMAAAALGGRVLRRAARQVDRPHHDAVHLGRPDRARHGRRAAGGRGRAHTGAPGGRDHLARAAMGV